MNRKSGHVFSDDVTDIDYIACPQPNKKLLFKLVKKVCYYEGVLSFFIDVSYGTYYLESLISSFQ